MIGRKKFVPALAVSLPAVFLFMSCCGIPALHLTEHDLSLGLEHDGYSREYILHLPENHDQLADLPLVIALHGGGGTAKGMIRLTRGRFNELADQHGFLVVYPQGLGKSWHDDRDDPISFAHENNIDDAGFLSALIKRMVQRYKADPRKIFVTGISNGGFMSFRVSRELAAEVKAVAPVCASIPHAKQNEYLAAGASNILLLNGTADPLVPYKGGYVEVLGKKRGRIVSTDETIGIFKKRNDITADPVVKELPDSDPEDGTRVIRYEYGNAAGRVVLMKVVHGGHTWPGGWQYLGIRTIGRTSLDVNACDALWEFFSSL